MNKFKSATLAAGVALASLVGVSASATTITLSTFSIGNFNAAASGGIIEDFEGYTPATPNVWDVSNMTAVGTFESLGGTGSGSTCQTQTGGLTCGDLALNTGPINGQGNLVPLGGSQSLSSNDTAGIFWNAFDSANGTAFNRIVFAVGDAADINGTVFTITADGVTETLTGQANNNEQLVVINLGSFVTGATVSMSTATNDAFVLDGATVAAVPVPAALPLLLAGIGGLGFMARRKRKAA